MKPLMLQGHERAITQIKYNREGDLLFSSAKDVTPNVWYSLNGERLGTYIGHTGAVWCIDVDWKTTKFLSGAADNTLRLWDVATGVEIGNISSNSAVRTCSFSYSADLASYSTDQAMKQDCEIFIVDARDDEAFKSSAPILRMTVPDSKVTSLIWGTLDHTIITGHEDGAITQWDLRTGKSIETVKDHQGSINDMQKNRQGTMFVTASKDKTSKLFDVDDLSVHKVYVTERPVNSASLSPIYDHVVLGGGQDAMDVTTTAAQAGKFDARFFHVIFEEEFARVKGHFGPINSLAFHPDGESFSTGGEDGFIRVQSFDPSYKEFRFDY
ncbi:eukaryotic translation initiation factor 3 subunit I-like [Metopolophium dirhodum]|uniref:eukaryotic translation initiation factor 3 subunit I-like n=1 Tax=Metopolophium dirhodum TaxID=44670 RepID=UPI00298F47C4|nr:eukaryotic translation initiation factor 3 subunit I-like [Metopolophium dirhodum]